ncbi:MAG: helix-turn-helix domain-containing protein [Syntrophothermus sp.]
MKDSAGHIHRLISEGEHQQLDFKFEITDARRIAHSLVAFANTDGGRLLIGVKDNGAIAGVRSDEEAFMLDAAASMYCNPPIQYESKEWTINNKTVLEIIVPKSKNRPHLAQHKDGKWMVYIRVGDQNLLANRVLLKYWENEGKPKGVFLKFTDKEKILLEYLQENPHITLSKFCRIAGINRAKAEMILVKFMLLKTIDIQFTEKLTLYMLRQEKH